MAARQERKFTDEEAQRFAALMAGFDTGNPSEAEAIGKVRVLRRMVVEKNLRVVDAVELPEIREAVDRQLQPIRAPQTVKVIKEGCRCEPWPVQMFWFFVGIGAWGVTFVFRGAVIIWKLGKLMWSCIE